MTADWVAAGIFGSSTRGVSAPVASTSTSALIGPCWTSGNIPAREARAS